MKYSELLLEELQLTPESIEAIKIVVFDFRKDIRVFISLKDISHNLNNKGCFLKTFNITGHILDKGKILENCFPVSKPTIIDTCLDKLDDVLDKIQLLT